MFKKILKYSFLIALTGIAFSVIKNNISYKQTNETNTVINSYEAKDDYQTNYPLSDYVSEGFESSELFRKFMLTSMFEYEDVIEENNLFDGVVFLIKNFFKQDDKYLEEASKLQYVESEIITVKEDLCDIYTDVSYNCEYTFTGVLDDGSKLTGELSLFANGEHSIVVSFRNEEGKINKDLAKLFVDDSNSEALVYYIIEETQKIKQTDLNPESAALKYYGSDMEQLAGGISYHAFVAYYLEEYNVKDEEKLYEKVAEVNLTEGDSDSFFVNRSF